jgi:pyrimidine operon attenuation protein/uracil phosphoribosyltransferase
MYNVDYLVRMLFDDIIKCGFKVGKEDVEFEALAITATSIEEAYNAIAFVIVNKLTVDNWTFKYHRSKITTGDREFDFYYLFGYLPRKFEPHFSNVLILSFKSGNNNLMRLFSDIVTRLILNEGIQADIVIPVPSSQAYRINVGLEYLCKSVSENLKVRNGAGYLERIATVDDSATGNRPSEKQHYDSIACKKKLAGFKVLLLDDVYTTGNTARACIRKLTEKGADDVTLITLSRTK